MGSKGRRIFNPPPPPNALGEGGAINRGMNYSGKEAEPIGQSYSPFGDYSQPYNSNAGNQPSYNTNSGTTNAFGGFFGGLMPEAKVIGSYRPFFTRSS